MMLNGFTSPFKVIRKGKLQLPRGVWGVVYDIRTKKHLEMILGDVAFSIGVKGGEGAKDSREFLSLISEISSLEEKTKKIDGICVVGGGSLGDLGAFAASVYRRGVRLVMLPTTYLSAIDSAFGGKTAINFLGAKNQVGTFYPAEMVFLHTKFFPKNQKLLQDAFAEILKMAILDRGLWKKMTSRPQVTEKLFWNLAPHAIRSKLRIVKRDPLEKKSERKLLNLGHTFGHVFEKIAGLSHGEAVALGLLFELEYFYVSERLKKDIYLDILDRWESIFDANYLLKKLGKNHSVKTIERLLLKDKKSSNSYISMPVVTGPGKVELSKEPLDTLLYFLKVYGVTAK